jgi:hypothetical protein
MDDHENDKQLAGTVMELSNELPIWNKRGDLLDILEHIPKRPVLETQHHTGYQTEDQGGQPQTGQVAGQSLHGCPETQMESPLLERMKAGMVMKGHTPFIRPALRCSSRDRPPANVAKGTVHRVRIT